MSQDSVTDVFPPTTIVLAKVKGYPAWPAMVLDEAALPDHILAKRPKTKSTATTTTAISANSSPKKKSNVAPALILPVRFFSDDTYIWINSHDIKLLSRDSIEEYFSSSSKKRRRDNLLETAYQLASDPPDMELFIKYGSRAAPPEEEEEEEQVQNVQEAQKPPRKKPGPKPKPKPEPKPRGKPGPKPKEKKPDPKKLAAEKKKQEEKKLLAEYDSDWGLEDLNVYDLKTGDYIFETEQKQESFFDQIPDATTIQNDLTKISNKFQKLEDKLVELLLSENDINQDVIIGQLSLLENMLNQLPKTVIYKSKLLRVLILTKRKPAEIFGHDQIKQKIDKILKKLDLAVRENTESELNSESKLATPDEESLGDGVVEHIPKNEVKDDQDVIDVKDEIHNGTE
ncbi:ISWI one complex protein 4 [Spathaspora sp. JA1]|nr:ISWI one complex protein 4 [Spathaspora sp. JA1]